MPNDLSQYAVQFPLGVATGETAAVSWIIPFGLRYAAPAPPSALITVDLNRVTYDPARQIAVVIGDDGRVLPAMKHTSTQTKTTTASQDRKGDDSDTDATGT